MDSTAPPVDYAVDWESRQRQNTLIITTVIMVVIAAVFVILRVISRFILIRTPGPDDYLIIGAMVFTIAYMAEIFVLKSNYAGYPMAALKLDHMVGILKATLAIEVTYYVIIFCIKTSICFTYLRFAVSSTFRKLCIGTIALHAVFFVICVIVCLAQCRPLDKMWDLMGAVVGTCIDTTAFFYTTSSFNIVTDIWIILLPIPTLRSINRRKKEKIALFCIFGVGSFAAIASIVRLHSIRVFTQAEDPFRDSIPVNLWSIIEVTIAIWCASVSALKPIFSRSQRHRSRTAATGSGGPSDGSKGSSWRRHRLGSKDQSSPNGTTLSSVADAPFPSTAPLPPLDAEEAPAQPAGAKAGSRRQQQHERYNYKLAAYPAGMAGYNTGSEDRVTKAASEESMIAFTPLSPRPRQSQTEDQMQGLPVRAAQPGREWSSSGSVLVLQKPS